MAEKKKEQAAELVNLGETLAELEKLLKRLGILYNQYFAGATKVPPQQLRLQAERMLRDLTQETIRNSTHRHKFHSLSATYASMQSLWSAKLRDRDNGSRRKEARGDRVARFSERRVSSFLQGKKKVAKKTVAAAPAEAAPAEPVAQGGAPTVSKAPAREPSGVEKLYDKIASFQRSANQPLTFQSPEQLRKFLAVQKAKIEQQTGLKDVQIRVVVEDGKLKFKAQAPQPGA
jgi:hypothetical protein